ncbi:Mov34/MPN/PAD-1 family protein [Burkholderia multivorans]|uniref:Mov34/MPN/PAD-1 family protein n=1 Tax=Burkholderia multivorans TaxID=87883 RepID=UPI001C2131EF|nr:Mov34/MPN/PAD-1 family protein [Burkholderia multivorans]MBU9628399.1 Mov34/MPN/PAD-1 family protein [Burkholderia multivorans]
MTKCYLTAFGHVELSDDVLDTLYRNRQLKSTSSEAGGQLFARFDTDTMVIVRATEPTARSRRGRTFFCPSRPDEQKEIKALFAEGLHYVGDWHSHPEPFPEPSSADITKMEGIYSESQHELNCMMILIVGTSEAAAGIWLGSISDHGVQPARPVD